MANENAVFLATNVDAIGPDCDVTDYDTVIAEMTSVRDDMVKFAQSLQRVANTSTDSLGHGLLVGATKASRHLGCEGQDAQACFAAAKARKPYIAVVTLELAAEMSNLLDALG